VWLPSCGCAPRVVALVWLCSRVVAFVCGLAGAGWFLVRFLRFFGWSWGAGELTTFTAIRSDLWGLGRMPGSIALSTAWAAGDCAKGLSNVADSGQPGPDSPLTSFVDLRFVLVVSS